MHPLGTRELEPSGRLAGSGLLTNTIGNPLETTIALSHLIFEGTLDRFPGLKICAAHGCGTGDRPGGAATNGSGGVSLYRPGARPNSPTRAHSVWGS